MKTEKRTVYTFEGMLHCSDAEGCMLPDYENATDFNVEGEQLAVPLREILENRHPMEGKIVKITIEVLNDD